MKQFGTRPDGLEVGNAWNVRSPEVPSTNWIVGEFLTIPKSSLRFMRQSHLERQEEGAKATDIAIKWFVHRPEDPPEWGCNKPTSDCRTISILADNGEFELTFNKDDRMYRLILDTPGDFAIWGVGLAHSWRPIKASTIITLRWKPE